MSIQSFSAWDKCLKKEILGFAVGDKQENKTEKKGGACDLHTTVSGGKFNCLPLQFVPCIVCMPLMPLRHKSSHASVCVLQ